MNRLQLEHRTIGPDSPPLVIAEIGINHEGDVGKAHQMIDDAARVGCECVKFQCHIPSAEMVPNGVVPGNTSESIWDLIQRCTLSEAEERELQSHTKARGMIYLSTPFSKAAADRLESMGVAGYKIGSGECNHSPLVEHVARKGKPVLLSTGMNTWDSIAPSVGILRRHGIEFALLHCTSAYPTHDTEVRLGAIHQLSSWFPDCVPGLSDHSQTIYPSLGAVALGACVVERHFTSDKRWPGPDIEISMDPEELGQLIEGSRRIFSAQGLKNSVLDSEKATTRFAYGSVVVTRPIAPGEILSPVNVDVKRPGTGEIRASRFLEVVGQKATRALQPNEFVSWSDLSPGAHP